MQLDKDFETQCKQVWVEAWVRTAQSETCVSPNTATKYADVCLEEFKKRFREVSVVDKASDFLNKTF